MLFFFNQLFYIELTLVLRNYYLLYPYEKNGQKWDSFPSMPSSKNYRLRSLKDLIDRNTTEELLSTDSLFDAGYRKEARR